MRSSWRRMLARELLGVLVADRLGQRLDRQVVADLLVLVPQLGLGVLEQLLGLAGAAQRVQRALGRGDGLASPPPSPAGRLGGDLGAGQVAASALPPSCLMRRSSALA